MVRFTLLMKLRLALALLFLTGFGLAETPAPTSPANETSFLTNARQLTFEGKRSGEGYFSADGKKMIFQSERETDNPFYQIYLLDLETGDTERISPGTGKTTCAWIHPDGQRVMFASTHLDPEAKAKQEAEFKERAENRVRKYSWDYDETFDLFEYELKTKTLKPLTHERGYDAEGCYSPDGKKIVFASNRAAYSRKLSPTDEERLKIDKQYFMDIYVMDADGTNVKQLTNVPGYDGGPFFSADGMKICWRRFSEKGDTAEIYTMNVDGSDQRQITRVGAMSWAPYFHPSGDYLIFTNNTQGFQNFELFIVDAQGKHDPVRVTYTDGFDGLPVFSPDGKTLAWTSGRTADGKSQIFTAEWNHKAALAALDLNDCSVIKEAGQRTDEQLAKLSVDITANDMKQHVSYLASDELEGRLTGTEGEKLATQYVANVFDKIGLLRAGEKDTWFENFDFTAGVALGEGNIFAPTHSKATLVCKVEKDWRPLSFSSTGKTFGMGIVFAGYGIETPESALNSDGKKIEPYDSYVHLDVKDKWVLVLRYLPEDISQERRNELMSFTSLRYKALKARQKGACGIIVASGPNSKVIEQLVPMTFDASLASSGIAAVSITDALADSLLKEDDKTLKELQTKLDKGEMVAGFKLKGWSDLETNIEIKQEKKQGRNVLGVLPAGNEPNGHVAPLIVCAHVDHLGSNGGSNSRAKGDDVKKIHHGADDNASGVAGVLEIAQWLADQKKQGKLDLKRDIIFAAWSGEELGLLGSNHFVEDFAKMIKNDPNAKLGGMFAACLNMDMIGRFNKTVVLQGVGSSSIWPKEIERRNSVTGLSITTQNDAHLPTDSTTFYLRGVPSLNAFTGAHEDYHMPSDTADKINYDKAAQIAKFMGLVARSLATSAAAPDYIAMETPKNQGTRTGLRVYLGTIPDYAQGDIKGVKLSGVSPIGPAAKAGVKAGDIIIKLGAKDIQNIYDYTYVMGDLKIGIETGITVLRDGKPVELKILPGSRD
ncbi:MAG: M28 family peptidase [Verrucomicrobia bacterium]|nr:M28 family peptidase [Verrucomicrobiota bacterium]